MRKTDSSLNKLFLFLIAMVVVGLNFSCSDDDNDNGPDLQHHDDNKMMAILHAMDDSMNMLQMTNDPDNDFAMMMKEHHKGAINMANLELDEGDDSTLHQIARRLITDQTKAIASLDSFLNVHPPALNDLRLQVAGAIIMEKMGKNADLQRITGDIDWDFAILMIQLHQAAMEMAGLEIYWGKDNKIKSMAFKMVEDQEMETRALQNWLLENNTN